MVYWHGFCSFLQSVNTSPPAQCFQCTLKQQRKISKSASSIFFFFHFFSALKWHTENVNAKLSENVGCVANDWPFKTIVIHFCSIHVQNAPILLAFVQLRAHVLGNLASKNTLLHRVECSCRVHVYLCVCVRAASTWWRLRRMEMKLSSHVRAHIVGHTVSRGVIIMMCVWQPEYM